MRRYCAFFILMITLTVAKSQTYFKMLPKDTVTWQHFNCVIPVSQSQKSTAAVNLWDQPIAALDTQTINSFKYKKVYRLNFYNMNYSGKTFIGYMREDTIARKIHFRETTTSPEVLVYDFSLNAGDSVLLAFPSAINQNGYYKADSIVVKNTHAGPRKHFYMRKHLNNPNQNQNYLVWIESIGCTYHALYPFAPALQNSCQFPTNGSCKHYWMIGLSCKHDNLVKKYQSCTYVLAQQNACMNPLDSCNYRNTCSSLRSNTAEGFFKVYPNPVNDKLQISFNEFVSGKITVRIYDLVGKLMMEKSDIEIQNGLRDIELKTEKLENGIYFVKVFAGEQTYLNEIIITH